MKNCGLSELRLVEPREKWPNDGANSMAAGADDILKNIKVFDNIPSALSDVIHDFSLTARNRDITKIELGPDYAAKKIYENRLKYYEMAKIHIDCNKKTKIECAEELISKIKITGYNESN